MFSILPHQGTYEVFLFGHEHDGKSLSSSIVQVWESYTKDTLKLWSCAFCIVMMMMMMTNKMTQSVAPAPVPVHIPHPHAHTIASTHSRVTVTVTAQYNIFNVIECSHDHVHGFLCGGLQLSLQQMQIFACLICQPFSSISIFLQAAVKAPKHSTAQHSSFVAVSVQLSRLKVSVSAPSPQSKSASHL